MAAPTLLTCPIVRMQLIRECDLTPSRKPPKSTSKRYHERDPISTARSVAHLLNEYLDVADREQFVVVCIDAKLVPICITTVHIGTLTSSIVAARDVFKAALLANASSIIIAHNHPSGDPTPSPEDMQVTQKLKELGEALDVPVLDHIVIGHERYFSFSEKGML